MLSHKWEYDEKEENRRCNNCKMSEFWDEDEEKWKWLSTEEFMDCKIVCKDE